MYRPSYIFCSYATQNKLAWQNLINIYKGTEKNTILQTRSINVITRVVKFHYNLNYKIFYIFQDVWNNNLMSQNLKVKMQYRQLG